MKDYAMEPGARPPLDNAAGSEFSSARRPHLLLVEDHFDTAVATAMNLEERGFRVTIAAGVMEALRAAASAPDGRVDLVISDLHLPDGIGADLMRELQMKHALRGIALSGAGAPNSDGAMAAGFVMHLIKPVDGDTLEAAVWKCLAVLREKEN